MSDDIHFGRVREAPIDWRSVPDPPDPDDEDVPTPEDVLIVLGFDPDDAEA